MKKSIGLAVIMFFALVLNLDAKYRGHGVEINYFYETLEPYGDWVELGADNYAWRPDDVGRNWSPYSEGRWVWSNDGWYWDSYEPFGWATYHYGRWYNDRYYGWVWTPGDEWAPAWVEWRYDNNYVGWAPLPPYAQFNTNYGIQFTTRWNSHYSNWKFVKYNRFTERYVTNHCVENHFVNRFFGKTKHITNYKYEGRRIVNRGINRSIIEKRGRIKIHTMRMNNVSNIRNRNLRGADNGSVRVFRPMQVEDRNSNGNSSHSFNKTANTLLLREKIKNGRENNQREKDYSKSKNTVENRKMSPKKSSSLSTRKNVKRNKSSRQINEKSKNASRQYGNSKRNSVQTKEKNKSIKSSNRKETKSNKRSVSKMNKSEIDKNKDRSSRISNSTRKRNGH